MSAIQVCRIDEQRMTARLVVVTSADATLRQRLKEHLTSLRWTVKEAAGAAEAIGYVEELRPEALLLDLWLPDLQVEEFAVQIGVMFPLLDVIRLDGSASQGVASNKSPRRSELLYALRRAQEGAILPPRMAGPALVPPSSLASPTAREVPPLPEMVGFSAPMRELARLVRLVAPRSTAVLIEGETGTGKDVVAKALHRLSTRAAKPFVVLNCAAIPESLLEAELFGHSRGAFTGAVQSRMGRMETARGGTLFLDEIGEMPLEAVSDFVPV